MAIAAAAARAAHASDPGAAAGASSRSRRARPAPVPARPRPHHPFAAFRRLAQDAGVRVPRGRPLPHPADPHARGGADRPLARPRAGARRGPGRGAGARPRPRPSRRSAMPASARSMQCLAAFGGFDHNAQTLRVVTALERRYADFDGLNLTWETLEGLVKHNGPLTDATASRSAATRARLPHGDRRLQRRARSRALELCRAPRRRSPRSPTTSPMTPTISTTACAPACSRSTIWRDVPLVGGILREVRGAAIRGSSRRALTHELMRRLITAHDRGRDRREPRAGSPRSRRQSSTTCASGRADGRLLGRDGRRPSARIKEFLFTQHLPPRRGHAAHGARPRQVVRDLFARYFARRRATCRPDWRAGLERADDARHARAASPISSPA